jgi:hypothetical protein
MTTQTRRDNTNKRDALFADYVYKKRLESDYMRMMQVCQQGGNHWAAGEAAAGAAQSRNEALEIGQKLRRIERQVHEEVHTFELPAVVV